MLDAQEVQAVVYDHPVLLYYANKNPTKNYAVSGESFNTEVYGIAIPEGSPLRESIDRALLKTLENGEYNRIFNKWFGVVLD